MMPKSVLPHWLKATKLWKHSKTMSFLLKCSPFPAFFSQYQAMVFSGLAMRPLAMSSTPLVDPRFEEVEQRAHRHVVLVDDLLRRIAIGEDGVEAFADQTDLGRNCVTLHAKVQVPVEVEIIVEIVPHERLAGKFRIQQLVEEGDDLVADTSAGRGPASPPEK